MSTAAIKKVKTKRANTRAIWYNTVYGCILLAIMSFGFSYLAASLAIDSGRLTEYFLTIILLICGVYWLVQTKKAWGHAK